jgi:hypothetical protein
MKTLAMAALWTMLNAAPALARTGAPRTAAAPAPVHSEDVERRLSKLAVLRFTPAFDGGFTEIVGLIKTLQHQTGPTDKIDAQDLATTALHSYIDHHRIDLGGDEETRTAKARQVASQAGLLEVLGW